MELVYLFTGTDDCGNQAQEYSSFIIEDTTLPTISCPATLALECGDINNNQLINAWLISPTVSDGCGDVTLTNDFNGTLPANCGGSVTVTFTATDECDNVNTCTATMTFDDTQAPDFLNCPMSDATIFSNATDCGDNVIFSTPIAIDGCDDAVTITQTSGPTSGSSIPVGTYTMTFEAVDDCGNTEVCSYNLTVEDNSAPSLVCPDGPIEACADAVTCQWESVDIGPLTAQDNCPDYEITYMITGSTTGMGTGDASGTLLNIGHNHIMYTIIDDNDNASTCMLMVMVLDCESPTLTCPTDTEVVCDGAGNTADLTSWLDSVTATDNCEDDPDVTATLFNTISGCGGTNTVTYEFYTVDNFGNESVCYADFTITDTAPPTITTPAAAESVVCNGDGNSIELAAWLSANGGAVASDVCGSVTWSNNFDGVLAPVCDGTGSYTVIFTATDECGNESTTTSSFTITDTVPPSIECPANITLSCNELNSAAIINNWLSSVSGTDACSDVTITNDYTALSTADCGDTGTTLVTFTATDGCDNVAMCTASIIIEDDENPEITTPPSDLILDCDGPTNAADIAAWLGTNGGAMGSDSCDDAPIWSNAITNMVVACGDAGTTTYAFTLTDACGNASSASANVIVEDTTPPNLTAPMDMVVECDGAGNLIDLTGWLATASTTMDCGAMPTINYRLDNSISGCGFANTEVYLFTATDACGNETTDTASFTIEDTVAPEITCPAAPLVLECGDNANSSAILLWLNSVTATDDCSTPVIDNNYDLDFAPDCGESGTTTVTFTATDLCGNLTTCVSTITIQDSTPPTIACPADLTLSCNNVNNEILITTWLTLATATDDCSDVTFTNDYTMGLTLDCTSEMGTVVTFTAIDECDNQTTCTASIILDDDEVPVITTFADDLILECGEANNDAAIMAWATNNGGAVATDNCDTDLTWMNVTDPAIILCGGTTITTYTFTVSDDCDNTAVTSANVILQDTEAPTLTIPTAVVESCDGMGNQALLSAWLATASAEDTCDDNVTVIATLDNTISGCGASEALVYLFTATDACGNSVSQQATFDVTDTTDPEITCPPLPLNLECGNPNNLNLVAAWLSTVTSSDDCSATSVANNFIGLPTDLVCNGGGSLTVTFTAVDECGNDTTCEGTITLDDTVPPVFDLCPADVTLNAGDDCGNTPIFSFPTASDDCDVTVTQTGGPASGTVFPLGTTAVEFTATDACGMTDVCTWNITIADLANPVIACPIGNTIKCVDTGTCQWISDSTVAPSTSIENCPGTTIDYTITGVTMGSGADDAAGEIFQLGTSTVTYTITDGSGNMSSCSFDVVVEDCEAPMITCAADITVECNDPMAMSLTDWQATVTGEDNCDEDDVDIEVMLFNSISGCGSSQGEVYLFTAIDDAGNTTTCLASYTIEDTTPPMITCPAEGLVLECGDPDNPMLISSWLATASATDGCDAPSVTNDYTSLPTDLVCEGGGSLTVTFTAEDGCNNTSTCTAIITINDTEFPVFDACPADITLSAGAECGATPIFSNPVATDNCDVTTVQTAGLVSGETFPLGTTTIEYTATDACGNVTVCTWDITVEDNTDPIVLCPSVDVVQCVDTGSCMWVSDMSVSPSFSTEDCPDFTITYDVGGATMASGSDDAAGVIFEIGTSLVLYTMTDGSGNVTTCSFNVIVEDCESPMISCPMNMTVECADPMATTLADWQAMAMATDNCDMDVTIRTELFNTISGCGSTNSEVYLFTATDGADNVSTCVASYTIVDMTAPEIVCPLETLELECGDPNNEAMINNWLATVTATDGCDTPVITNNYSTPPEGFTCDGTGLISVVFTATDACGNSTNCTADITINDSGVPTITCPADLTLECNNANNQTLINIWLAGATADDDCSDVAVTNDFGDMLTLDCSGANGTIVTFTASDECDNTAVCTAAIFLEDDENPVIMTPPSDLFLECDGAGNIAEIEEWITDNTANNPALGMVAQDNCGMVTITAVEGTSLDDCGNETIITYTFTATDICGNSTDVNATVFIEDTAEPVLTLPTAPASVLCTGDVEVAFQAWLDSASASDICATATVSSFLFQESMTCDGTSSIITREYTFTATDACSNTTVDNAVFTIIDDIDPIIEAPADLVMQCGDDFSAESTAWLTQYTVIDACQTTTVTNDFSGVLPDVCGGTIPVVWTVIDGCGASATATANIIIEADVTGPMIDFCPTDIVFTTEVGQCDAVITFGTPTATDCNSPVTITQTGGPAAGTMLDAGMTETIEFTATDNCGNTSICTFDVSVVDEQVPVINCPSNDVVKCNSTGTCTWVSDNDVSPINFTDNCPNYTISYTIDVNGVTVSTGADDAAGEVFGLGESVVTYMIMDAMGNPVSSCSFMVVVEDCDEPTITCSDVLGIECNGQSLSTWYDSIAATAMDNCDEVLTVDTLLLTDISSCGFTFDRVYQYTVTDAAGNFTTCLARYMTVDTEGPEITTPATDLTLECDGTSQSIQFIGWLNSSGGAVATDDCGDNITWTNNYVGAVESICPGTSNIPVTFTAIDECGNSTETSATFRIEDTTPPVLNLPQDITLDCGDPFNTFFVLTWINGASALDVCGGFTFVTHDAPGVLEETCGETIVQTITFTATDQCGNATSDTRTVTTTDTTPPMIITQPDDFVTECGMAMSIDDWLASNGGAVAIDQCSDEPLVWSYEAGPAIDGCGESGEVEYIFTVTDNCGNASTTTASLLTSDTTLPILTPPTDLVEECGNVMMDVDTWAMTAMATDNCGIATIDYELWNSNVGCGSTIFERYLFTATDECGNESTAFADYRTLDTTDPVITCPDDLFLECGDDQNAFILQSWLDSATAEDAFDCSAVTVSGETPAGLPDLDCEAIDGLEVEFTAVDECGNSTTCIATIFVIDSIDPVFVNCPQDIVVNVDVDLCASNPVFSTPIATDDCEVTVTQTVGPPSGSEFPLGDTPIEFTAVDACGNTTTCNFTLTVIDSDEPMILCPSNAIEVGTDSGVCVWTADDQVAPSISVENCPGQMITYTVTGATSAMGTDNAAGVIFELGTSEVCYTITDGSGNASECCFDVVVEDLELPMITCPADVTLIADTEVDGVCLGAFDWINPTPTDNCGVGQIDYTITAPDWTETAFANVVAGDPASSTFAAGTSYVEYTVTDVNGNTNTCQFKVDVIGIKHEKSIARVTQNPDDSYCIEYNITVFNTGNAGGLYSLNDLPDFDDDFVILSAEYSSSIHVNTTLPTTPPAGGWVLGTDELMPGFGTHIYTLTVCVIADLKDPNTPGDGLYTLCGDNQDPATDLAGGQGLYNESLLDVDGDQLPDLRDTVCADIPYVTHVKDFLGYTRNPDGTYDVQFKVTVDNIGGATGLYDLLDEPFFDDDFVINGASYVTDISDGMGGFVGGGLTGTGPWTLADDQGIVQGERHCYTLTVNVTINLSDPATVGDEIYVYCGSTDPLGMPQRGEGLYNETALDRSNDGNPEEVEFTCGDIEIVDLALTKVLVTQPPYAYGQVLDFDIEITNQGNIDMYAIEINDYLPIGYDFASVTTNDPNWSMVSPGVLLYDDIAGPLAPTQSITVPLQLILLQTSGGTNDWDNYAELGYYEDVDGVDKSGEDVDSTPDSIDGNDNPVVVGDPDDNNIYGGGPLAGEDEDDHDPAGPDIFDLALRKTLDIANTNAVYGGIATFNIEVFNQGNEEATNITVTDAIPCGFTFDGGAVANAGWIYDLSTNTVTNTIASVLAPGTSQLLPLELTLVPCTNTGAFTNFAEISQADDTNPLTTGPPLDVDSTPDSDLTNDVGGTPNDPAEDNNISDDGTIDEDDHDPEELPIFDLALRKTIANVGPYNIGQIATFEIEVFNQGNVTADQITINDYLNSGFTFDPVLNPNWTNTGGVLSTVISTPLVGAASTIVTIDLTVAIDSTPANSDWYNYAEIANATDANGLALTDIDSTPNSNSAAENAVLPGDADDNNIDGLGPNAPNGAEDEDDHDPAAIIVVGGLGDTVWKDLDGDGIQDVGEPGVQGVVVTAFTCSGDFIGQMTTDAVGYYFFRDLLPGDYYLSFDISNLPVGCAFTQPGQGIDPALDSNADINGLTDCITVLGGEFDETIDVGLIPLASLGNYVWHDLNGDGIQDGNEPGIPGVAVALYNANGNLVDTQLTDANGFYLFEDLYPGDYYLDFIGPIGFQLTSPNQGSNTGLDSDVTGGFGPGTTGLINLSAGENDLTWDAGYFKCVPIGDIVWYDSDGDGLQDITENGINGINVNIYRLEGSTWVIHGYQFTGHEPGTASNDGYWKLCVPPGTYYISYSTPAGGLGSSIPNVGSDEDLDSDITNANGFNTTDTFTVISGDDMCDIGAGFSHQASLSGIVWCDLDGDGGQEDLELGKAGIPIHVYTCDGTLIRSTVTDANGNYSVTGLQAIEYYVGITLPTGFTPTISNAQPDDIDSDLDYSFGLNTTDKYLLIDGQNVPNIDIGLVETVILAAQELDLTLTRVNDKNTLDWTILDDQQVSYYTVEKRMDSSAFEEVGSILSNQQSYAEYDFIDYNSTAAGVYYYRVIAYYESGNSITSNVVSTQVEVEEADLTSVKLYPVPAVSSVTLEVNVILQGSKVGYSLIDRLGRYVVSNQVLTDNAELGIQKYKLDLTQYPSGVYSVEIIVNNDSTSKQLIIME
jgi:uncharacterized repeat protein (TIGR01451 family)